MDKLRTYIKLTLKWLWNAEADVDLICDEIYDSVMDSFYLNDCIRAKGYLAIDDVQVAVRNVLLNKILN